jgi:hypothetical protein
MAWRPGMVSHSLGLEPTTCSASSSNHSSDNCWLATTVYLWVVCQPDTPHAVDCSWLWQKRGAKNVCSRRYIALTPTIASGYSDGHLSLAQGRAYLEVLLCRLELLL